METVTNTIEMKTEACERLNLIGYLSSRRIMFFVLLTYLSITVESYRIQSFARYLFHCVTSSASLFLRVFVNVSV